MIPFSYSTILSTTGEWSIQKNTELDCVPDFSWNKVHNCCRGNHYDEINGTKKFLSYKNKFNISFCYQESSWYHLFVHKHFLCNNSVFCSDNDLVHILIQWSFMKTIGCILFDSACCDLHNVIKFDILFWQFTSARAPFAQFL